MDRDTRADAGRMAVAAGAVRPAITGSEEDMAARGDHLADLAVEGVVGVMDLVGGELQLGWDAREAPAVVDDLGGAVAPPLVEDGLEHDEGATRVLDSEERIVVEPRPGGGHQHVRRTHRAVRGDGRRPGKLRSRPREATDDRVDAA